eukprot:gene1131-12328_t
MVDVVMTMRFGDMVFNGGHIHSLLYARDNFLKKNESAYSRVFPTNITWFVAPVHLPEFKTSVIDFFKTTEWAEFKTGTMFLDGVEEVARENAMKKVHTISDLEVDDVLCAP